MKVRSSMIRFLKITEMCHLLVAQYLEPGQTAVDATAGNGQDTLFLARLVGPQGRVYAFDIQEEALLKTGRLLEEHNCRPWVQLIHDSHEKMDSYIQEPVQAMLYNLGYLPGGDKALTTAACSTESSLTKGISLLAPGGIIALVVYTGHPGGKEESSVVRDVLASLPAPQWQVFSWSRENGAGQAPYLLIAHKES